MNRNSNICNNCGKAGHMFHQCKLPITSYGIIVFRPSSEGLQFLMIRRKDSFGYIDFMRGKYSLYNLEQLQTIIDEMSLSEKDRILNEPFDNLWKNMWKNSVSSQFKNEELVSCKKFYQLKEGIIFEDERITLADLVNKSETKWAETEWEFPKGRRNPKEKDLECAMREFEEETGILCCKIKIVENVLPFEEIFIGTNHKSYKHKYFLAYLNEPDDLDLENYQISEVSKQEWKNITNCLKDIRPYNLEKKKLIENINKVLQEYRLYS